MNHSLYKCSKYQVIFWLKLDSEERRPFRMKIFVFDDFSLNLDDVLVFREFRKKNY
jgi:hypothetical protein